MEGAPKSTVGHANLRAVAPPPVAVSSEKGSETWAAWERDLPLAVYGSQVGFVGLQLNREGKLYSSYYCGMHLSCIMLVFHHVKHASFIHV
jgi:hypothetical protein